MAKIPTAPAPARAGSKKQQVVNELCDKLSRAKTAIATDYRGLSVKQLQELRAQLRVEGVDYLVVKNTLARRAVIEANVEAFTPAFTGPVGLAIGYEDISAPARLLNDYFKVNPKLTMTAGFVEGQLLDASAVKKLATLPSREALLAQLAGSLQSPLSSLAGSIETILSNLAAILNAYSQKLATKGAN